MMNNVCLMGRLTRDPELRTVKGDVPVAKFTLAVDRPRYGQGEKKADFIPVVTWRKTAEFVDKWYKKGILVYVVGRIETRSWDDENGKRQYAFGVVASETNFAESKRNDTGNTQPNHSDGFPDDFMPSFSDDDLLF